MLETDLNPTELEAPVAQSKVVVRTVGCVLAASEVPALLERLEADPGLALGAIWLPGNAGSMLAEVRARHPRVRVCADLDDLVEAYSELDLVLISDHEGVVTRETALGLIDLGLMYDARLAAFEGIEAPASRYAEVWRLGVFIDSSRDEILRRAPDSQAVEHLTRIIDQQSGGHLTKRIIDVVVSAIALVVTAPLMALVAIVVRLDSPGPALFVQDRLGYRRRPFRVFKFRSMRADTSPLSSSEPCITEKDDARVTRAGRFLRKSRLDELPQLLNVLKGEMSVVGPRPIRAFRADELATHIPFYNVRFTAKPGLTGTAQVYYKYPFLDIEHIIKFKYELKYIQKRSFWYDLKLMVLTILVLLGLKGA